MWEGLVLDDMPARMSSESGIYTDVTRQVCLCDVSSDCASPTSWYDLGYVYLEPAKSWFLELKQTSFSIGRGRLAIGGDLLERYRTEDLTEYWPRLASLHLPDH